MNKVIPAFEISLLEPVFSSSIELSEMGIDSLLDDGVFKNIPIVSLLVGVGKTAQNIHDRNLLKQTLNFIKTFNDKQISKEKLGKYKEAINKNPKKAEKELERVLIILNSNVEIKKSQMLAQIYRAYVEEIISWEQFCELSDVITRLFIIDIDLLYKVYNNEVTDTSQCRSYQADRLISLGLLDSATKSLSIGNTSNSQTVRYISINKFGDLFCNIIK
ncbi:hypothetical protein [Clostridium algidicarnis]|uniref:Uncharacterized protein n=1 Tax=Clostridium algidicarnis TaxID=37659 RepID=A0ABS6C6C5_9CLOT|nr:hypothetical protein [Clostridium algidicarnis]MBU3221039.1 hypothetical protein [Clostridium algidicarnis]